MAALQVFQWQLPHRQHRGIVIGGSKKVHVRRSVRAVSRSDAKKGGGVSSSNYVVPLDKSSYITRPLAEILRDLNKKIPENIVKHSPASPPFFPWYRTTNSTSLSSDDSDLISRWSCVRSCRYQANRMLSFYAPGTYHHSLTSSIEIDVEIGFGIGCRMVRWGTRCDILGQRYCHGGLSCYNNRLRRRGIPFFLLWFWPNWIGLDDWFWTHRHTVSRRERYRRRRRVRTQLLRRRRLRFAEHVLDLDLVFICTTMIMKSRLHFFLFSFYLITKHCYLTLFNALNWVILHFVKRVVIQWKKSVILSSTAF